MATRVRRQGAKGSPPADQGRCDPHALPPECAEAMPREIW
jgi:hypothetical protein